MAKRSIKETSINESFIMESISGIKNRGDETSSNKKDQNSNKDIFKEEQSTTQNEINDSSNRSSEKESSSSLLEETKERKTTNRSNRSLKRQSNNKKRSKISRSEKNSNPDEFDTEYEKLFFTPVNSTIRSGKVVYINQEHHTKINKVIHILGDNKISISALIDNIIAYHFEEFHDDIMELYNSKRDSLF